MTIHRMPTAFGPNPGPRQAYAGVAPFDALNSPYRRSMYVSFETDGDAIAGLLPPSGEMRGAPEIAFEYSFLKDIDWLAGRGYNMLSVLRATIEASQGKNQC